MTFLGTSHLIGVQERTFNSKVLHSNRCAWVIKPGTKCKKKLKKRVKMKCITCFFKYYKHYFPEIATAI